MQTMVGLRAALSAALLVTFLIVIGVARVSAEPESSASKAQQEAALGSMAIADLPKDSEWVNPFCDASALIVPWNKERNAAVDGPSDTYALFAWGHAKSNYTARLTMMGDGEAYSVLLPKVEPARSSAGAYAKATYFVSLGHYVDIAEYFVDGVGVDGAGMSDCPSFVKPIASFRQLSAQLSLPTSAIAQVNARYTQAVPRATCGSVYRSMHTTKPYFTLVGYYGDHGRDADVQVFVDSSGQVVKTRIWRSSGVDGIDAAALASAQNSTYESALFMCTPVVSSEIIRVEYKP